MDAKMGVIFGCVLAVVLLIFSAMNMGNIKSAERQIKKVAASQKSVADSNAEMKKRLDQLQDDLTKARTKIARIESRVVGGERAAEESARTAAKNYLDTQREEMIDSAVEKALAKIDLDRLKRDVADLRRAARRADRGEAKGEPGGEARAKAPADPIADTVRRGIKDAVDANDELGLTEKQKEKAADAIGKGIGDFFTLMQKRRDGEITDEEFREQVQELREKARENLEGNLTEEQREKMRERMEEMRNRRGRRGGGDEGGGGEGGGADEAF